ncbi:MAG TPA: glycosyltransferase, partial [Verrucomicrobiae bacterium]|nr:glycosyltransferase [Verrucomicrobiae bacterium]
LPAHLDSMQPWLDLASEVVVVDSHSTDGTVELIQERLKHPGLRVHMHPRGLYQSWNFGLSQLTAKYAYISTVGDSITRAGLEHLHAAAESLNCDVIVSKPRFIANDGAPVDHEIRWPIDDVLTSLRIAGPTPLEGLKLFFFTLIHLPAAVLGSSASNLYRTDVLQRRPFPTDYGTVGDGAWGALNVFDCRLGVTPEMFSTFRHHPKAYSANEYAVQDIGDKLFHLACETFYQRLAVDAGLRARAARVGFDELPRIVSEQRKWHKQLEVQRERKLPWIFNARAWQARSRRNHFEELMRAQWQTVKKALTDSPEQACLAAAGAAGS